MYIDVNSTKLFFDVYGSKLSIMSDSVKEKPTLIVLHGGHGFADHTLYVEFWSQFADMAQVIFLDQRGCGRSSRASAAEWNLHQWAEDLNAFCKALAIERPIIAGVSMGGHVMSDYVTRYADQAGGLIFCNTEAHFPLDLVCEKLHELGGDIPSTACHDFFTNPTMENFAAYVEHCIPHYARNAYNTKELSRCIKNPDVFLHYCKEQMLQFDYLGELHKINCPTLFMVGDESLHVVPAAKAMAEKINKKYVQMEIFENAGAPVYKDQPEHALQVVKSFLSQLKGR